MPHKRPQFESAIVRDFVRGVMLNPREVWALYMIEGMFERGELDPAGEPADAAEAHRELMSRMEDVFIPEANASHCIGCGVPLTYLNRARGSHATCVNCLQSALMGH